MRLAVSARERMEASRRTVERIIEEGRVVYGVNTGFGKLSDISIPPDELRELQINLVRSHACGVGECHLDERARLRVIVHQQDPDDVQRRSTGGFRLHPGSFRLQPEGTSSR